jgi:hypothetical protein
MTKTNEFLQMIYDEQKMYKYYNVCTTYAIFNHLHTYFSKRYNCKLIDTDISVTDLRMLLDSNEYDIVFFDTVGTMSRKCVNMLKEFLAIYQHDTNRQLHAVIFRTSSEEEGYNKQYIIELRCSEIGDPESTDAEDFGHRTSYMIAD